MCYTVYYEYNQWINNGKDVINIDYDSDTFLGKNNNKKDFKPF